MSVTARSGTHDGTGTQLLVAAAGRRSAVVSDRGRLRALTSWCAQVGIAHETLRALDVDDPSAIDPATCTRLAAQLRRAGQVLRTLDVPGLAWIDQQTGAILGGTVGAALREADGTALRCAGAEIVGRTQAGRAWLEVHEPGRTVEVEAWAMRGGQTLVHPQGLTLTGAAQAELWQLSRGADVRVGVLPAPAVVAGLVTTLPELALVAARSGVNLRISTNIDRD